MTQHELAPGAVVEGLEAEGAVTLDQVDRLAGAATLYWRDRWGVPRSRLLFPDELERLTIRASGNDIPTLDADVPLFRRAFAAHRLRDAHLHAPLLAVASAAVEPLPHQLQAVYEQMLPRQPLRFLLADDPGAGKTIMAGLYIKELLARRAVHRCIVVAPGSLVEQWQEELHVKFGLRFAMFDRALADQAADGNPFSAASLLIARVDQLARDKGLLGQLAESSWDLAVVDEAHKLTARYWGQKVVRSKRFELGAALAVASKNFLLMTATPHSGKEQDFQLFLSLLDPDRFTGRVAAGQEQAAASDLLRRLVKEQLRHLDGRPLFPERRASTVRYELTPLERELYERVSEYVRHEMDKVASDDTRRTVGFALLVLQRRLASSPEAVLRSLSRRCDRLRAEAEALRDADQRLHRLLRMSLGQVPEDDDDAPDAEREDLEDEAASGASASRSLIDLETEILLLQDLVVLAAQVRAAGVDRKWEQLARLLTGGQMYDVDGRRRKIIVFTEHRDTLSYLHEKVVDLLGDAGAVCTIHGGVSRAQRRAVQDAFTADRDVSVLLATDAAGEGVNLQVAHLMVNYDLPWNPNRLEQRFGRIHRIGQAEVCHLWNLVASDTREGDVFTTLLDKLAAQREALGDQVFDVLGEVLTGSDLNELLTQAIRYGDQPEVRAKLDQVVSTKVGGDLEAAVAQRRRHLSDLTEQDLRQARRSMALAAAAALQPHVVEPFVREALPMTRTEISDAGDGRYVVPRVSSELRQATESSSRQVERRYDLVTFDPATLRVAGRDSAELLGPGHPLVDALADLVLETSAGVLRRGVALRDGDADEPFLVVLIRLVVRAGNEAPSERIVALAVNEQREPYEVAPQLLALLPAADAGETPPDPAVVQALLQSALEHAAGSVATGYLQSVREAVQAQRTAGLEEARHRLEAEARRITAQRDALLRRAAPDPQAVAALEHALEDLRTRLQARDAQAVAQVELLADPPEIAAVAWVQAAGAPGSVGARRAARAEVARALQGQGAVEEALPYAGYDLLVTPHEGPPRFVAVRTAGERLALSPVELHVRRNVGASYEVAVVRAGGVGWSRSGLPEG